MYIYMYTHAYVHTHVCACMYKHVCVYTCMYTYVYTYVYIHMHIYIHTFLYNLIYISYTCIVIKMRWNKFYSVFYFTFWNIIDVFVFQSYSDHHIQLFLAAELILQKVPPYMEHKIQAFEGKTGMGDPGPHSLRLPPAFFHPYLPSIPWTLRHEQGICGSKSH